MSKQVQEQAPSLAQKFSRRALLRSAAVMGGASTVALLAACNPAKQNSSNATSNGGSTSGNSAKVAIRVWGYGLDDARAQARLASLQKSAPNITVSPVGGDLNTQQLLTAVASGDPPEVVNVDRTDTGSWAGRGAIDPIDDLVSRDKFELGQFYPVLVDQVKYNGKLYGIPQFVNVDLIYLNLDVFKEVGVDPATFDPGNWDLLQQLGAKLAKVENGKVVRTGFDTKMQDNRLWLWAWANGTTLISADGKKANFTDPKVIEALAWGKATVDKQGGEKARAAFAQAQNFFSAQNPVLIGQTASTVFEQWLIGVLKVNPQANFTPLLPRMRNSKETLTDATGSAFAIPRGIKGDKREGAWTFIKDMTSTAAWVAGEQATAADNKAKNTPYHPTISGNVKADQEAWTNIYKSISPGYDQAVKLFPEALKVARYTYSGPVAAQIHELMTASINDALQGAKPPEQAMTELQAKAQKAIDEFQPT